MKQKTTTAWALQRPTGEILPTFVRRTRAEVIASVIGHLRKHNSASQWRTMRRNGFVVVRVAVKQLKQSSHQLVQ